MNEITIILDSNIYDKIAVDTNTNQRLNRFIQRSLISIIVPRTIAEELGHSPFKRVPVLFPVKYLGNTVGDVDMRACDSIGSGKIFHNHLGRSSKVNDAYIVDAATWYADWLISEDKRLLKRAQKVAKKIKCLTYTDFVHELLKLDTK